MRKLRQSYETQHASSRGVRPAGRVVLNTIDMAIAAVAGPQHGVITTRQLLALGLTPRQIHYRTQIGRLHHLHHGVYAVGHRPVSPHARALAAVLACGAGAALSHGSAATLWGIRKHWAEPLEVTTTSGRPRPRIKVHRSRTLTRRDVTRHFGIPVTSPARTVLDVATEMTDVGLSRGVNDLRLAGFLSLAELAEVVARHPRPCDAKRLRAQVAHPEQAPTRKEFEDAFLLFVRRYGLPEPEVNTRVLGHEADALFRAHNLVVELDGWRFHSDRAAFESDRDRDADLLVAGIATVRVTWKRMTLSPGREAARLHAILARRATTPF